VPGFKEISTRQSIIDDGGSHAEPSESARLDLVSRGPQATFGNYLRRFNVVGAVNSFALRCLAKQG
jgi:hypothetical protein